MVFVVGDTAYVGSGTSQYGVTNAFSKFNSASNSWTAISSFPGIAHSGGVAFSLNGKGYFGTGHDGTTRMKDFWEYDINSDSWTQLGDFGSTARDQATAFTIGGRGYIGMGQTGSGVFRSDLWEYDPVNDSWTARANYGGGAYAYVMGMPIADKAYLCMGYNGVNYNLETWEYTQSVGVSDNISGKSLKISADPVAGKYSFTTSGQEAIDAVNVYNTEGKMVYNSVYRNLENVEIDIFNQSPGLYLVHIWINNAQASIKILKL